MPTVKEGVKSTRDAIYFHFVWATRDRLPLIRPDFEADLHRVITSEVTQAGAKVIAIGGVEDHIHLLVRPSTALSPSHLMQRVKGVSSQVGRRLGGEEALFRWQHGYGVFSLSRVHVPRAIAYVAGQREHHGNERMWSEWEPPTGEGHAEMD